MQNSVNFFCFLCSQNYKFWSKINSGFGVYTQIWSPLACLYFYFPFPTAQKLFLLIPAPHPLPLPTLLLRWDFFGAFKEDSNREVVLASSRHLKEEPDHPMVNIPRAKVRKPASCFKIISNLV